ncbi:MAG: peptidyl-prolyl cis-trans isomerase [Candidatus Edwardsbacteria bacterium]
MPKIKIFLLAIISLICLIFSCAQKQNKATILAKVGKADFTTEDFQTLIPLETRLGISPEAKENFLKEWIENELLYQEAKRRGLEHQLPVELQIKQVLATQLLLREIGDKIKVNESEALAYFEKHKSEYDVKLRLSCILIPTEKEANEILDSLKGGTEFARLAKNKSKHLSANQGGEIGYIQRGDERMSWEFEEAVFSMKPGGVSPPIRLADGYYVVKVNETRELRQKPKFEDVSERLIRGLTMAKQKKAYDELIAKLKEKTEIEMYPERIP